VEIITYPGGAKAGTEPPIEVFESVYPEGFRKFIDEQRLVEPLLEKRLEPGEVEQLEGWLRNANSRFQVGLVLSASSISHTSFRRLLTGTEQARMATMPGVELPMFAGVMTADWNEVERRSIAAAEALSAAESATVISGGGRELRFSLEGRSATADTGILKERGQFGNLPGGEGFIAPVEGTAEGELSVGPPEDPGRWWFRFAKGNLVEVHGNPPFEESLEKVFAQYPQARNLAELGVGTNEKAQPSDSVLESEKILGTIHLAVGDNAGFGGKVAVPYHQDYVVYSPTLHLDGASGRVTLVDAGVLKV
jgi:leucyl aminopeptidase (aminopeptidase T)